MQDTGDVRQFIVDNFLFGEDSGFGDSESFREMNIMDSTGILELIAFLEETYEIAIDDDELVPENLDSVEKIAHFIERKTADSQVT